MAKDLTTLTSNGTAASAALLGEQVPKAISTVGSIVTGGELLPGQNLVAVCAGEAVTMERMRLVGNASLVDDLQENKQIFNLRFERGSNSDALVVCCKIDIESTLDDD